MFQSADDVPNFVDNFQNNRETSCSFHIENEVEQFLPSAVMNRVTPGRFSPNRFYFGPENEQNVHGIHRNREAYFPSTQTETRCSFRGETGSQSDVESVCSFVTIDRYAGVENVPDNDRARAGYTRSNGAALHTVDSHFPSQFDRSMQYSVPVTQMWPSQNINMSRNSCESYFRSVPNFQSNHDHVTYGSSVRGALGEGADPSRCYQNRASVADMTNYGVQMQTNMNARNAYSFDPSNYSHNTRYANSRNIMQPPASVADIGLGNENVPRVHRDSLHQTPLNTDYLLRNGNSRPTLNRKPKNPDIYDGKNGGMDGLYLPF